MSTIPGRIPRILLTAGEPAGIGPDILIQLAQHTFAAELCVVADPELLQTRAAMLGLPLVLTEISLPFNQTAVANYPSELKILPQSLSTSVTPGSLDSANSQHVMQCLRLAAELTRDRHADALVTGPIHKSIINDAGIAFTGHTEFLAELCQAQQVLMLFVVDDLKVALATTHLPLANVPQAITAVTLTTQLNLLADELKNKFKLSTPRILLCGLNPHAGENGYLGREEIEVMAPAVAALRQAGRDIIGPLPADTIFTREVLASGDVVFAMYHDQALPVVKYIGFDRAVNVTLGLPMIRTSVDHGTALSIAGTGKANPNSLLAAVALAIQLANNS